MSPLKYVAAFLASSFAASVFAAPINFDLRAGQTEGSYVYTRNYSMGGLGLSVTGWSNISTTNDDVRQTYVGKWSQGLGVEDISGSPEHAIDNKDKDFDMLLLSFSEAVTLNSIDLGYIHNSDISRSDVSILAGTSSLTSGISWTSLLSLANGWKTAGNYDNVGTNAKTVNLSSLSAKYWLVGAYNPIQGNILPIDNKYDAFKLEKVSVTKTIVKVPEPSALFLFGLGLLGLAAVRRRSH